MRLTFYDLETTGLDPVRSDIIQAAYAVFDDDVCKRSGILHFFYDGMTQSSPEAYAKHGMSYEYLMQFKDEFKGNCHKLYSFLSGARVVGYNNLYFDDTFVKTWLKKRGAPEIQFKESIDVMKMAAPIVNKSRISLIKLCKHFGISDEEINKSCKEWFGTEGHSHAAFYDVAATRLCYLRENEIIMHADEEIVQASPEGEVDMVNVFEQLGMF